MPTFENALLNIKSWYALSSGKEKINQFFPHIGCPIKFNYSLDNNFKNKVAALGVIKVFLGNYGGVFYLFYLGLKFLKIDIVVNIHSMYLPILVAKSQLISIFHH